MSVEYIGPPFVISASAILPSLCILAVGLRFYTRRIQHLDLRPDDWLTLPALVTMQYPQPIFRLTYHVWIDPHTRNGGFSHRWSATLIGVDKVQESKGFRRRCQRSRASYSTSYERRRPACFFEPRLHSDFEGASAL